MFRMTKLMCSFKDSQITNLKPKCKIFPMKVWQIIKYQIKSVMNYWLEQVKLSHGRLITLDCLGEEFLSDIHAQHMTLVRMNQIKDIHVWCMRLM